MKNELSLAVFSKMLRQTGKLIPTLYTLRDPKGCLVGSDLPKLQLYFFLLFINEHNFMQQKTRGSATTVTLRASAFPKTASPNRKKRATLAVNLCL